MNLPRLILRSLTHYRRQHLGVVFGVAITTTVITGALLIGDSIRFSLRTAALKRLGDVSYAMPTADRFFRAELADTAADPPAAATLQLQAVAVTPDLSARANNVQVLGIDERFAALLKTPAPPEPGSVMLNTALARQLNADIGQTLILRFTKPSALSQDLPMGFEEGVNTVSLRVNVSNITDDQFGLRAEQTIPLNAYLPREWLAEQLGLAGKANLMLASGPIDHIEKSWQLTDAQLNWRKLDDGRGELSSDRVFIDKPIEQALTDLPGERILTYFVNTIAHGDRQTPYSMVAAFDEPLDDDQIAINTWLADDLDAGVGDTITLTYFVADAGRKLEEASATFKVARIVPIEDRHADRSIVPEFPGLADVDQISDWDGGPMIDRSRIRDKDEDYWDNHRATPKAFISFKRGQSLWSNRFGTLTAIRLNPGITPQQIQQKLDPAAAGLTPRDIRAPALQASKATVDFSSLFLGLSFFLIVSAVLLTGLLFVLGVNQRAREWGTLAAVGWPTNRVRTLVLAEGIGAAAAGSLLGLLGGMLYTALVLRALSGTWSGAVGGTQVMFHVEHLSLLIGLVSGIFISAIAMYISVRAMLKKSVRSLLYGSADVTPNTAHKQTTHFVIASALILVAASLYLFADPTDAMAAAGAFFGIGAALLTAGIFFVAGIMSALSGRSGDVLTLPRLALANITRRRMRSLSVVALIACGVFIVIAVSGFYQSAPNDPTRADSGTGGFTLIAESTLPILYDLNTMTGLDQYGLDEEDLPGGSVVSVRVGAGDDASCLNLNQVPTPRLLGVRAERLAGRDSFTVSDPAGWSLLDQPTKSGAVPAIADANTAQWALKLKVGDTVTLTDGRGEPFDVKLVATINNSILQGSLIVSESAFTEKYPGVEGYRMLLINTPSERLQETSEVLTQVLADMGVAVTPTTARLASYNAVQNTYLTIFQALGGLGLLLGTAGIGVVVTRNMLERRGELAMMRAVGFTRRRQRWAVALEHAGLLALGLLIGTGASVVAVLPGWRGVDTLGPMAVTVLVMWVTGLVWVYVATRRALSGRLIAALRSE